MHNIVSIIFFKLTIIAAFTCLPLRAAEEKETAKHSINTQNVALDVNTNKPTANEMLAEIKQIVTKHNKVPHYKETSNWIQAFLSVCINEKEDALSNTYADLLASALRTSELSEHTSLLFQQMKKYDGTFFIPSTENTISEAGFLFGVETSNIGGLNNNGELTHDRVFYACDDKTGDALWSNYNTEFNRKQCIALHV